MKRKIEFSKMHGLGNDFMIVDATTQNISFSSKIICSLSDRYRGIGFDQLLVVETSCNPNFDFYYRIFNADGSEAFQCGNGARCFARFVYLKKLTNKRNITISTKFNKLMLSVTENENICVNMGIPELKLGKIFFKLQNFKNSYRTKFQQEIIQHGIVFIGNYHCILQVKDVDLININLLSKILKKHESSFKEMNIGFMQIINNEHIKLRVYERGIGETQACGSGACAAVAIGIYQNLLGNNVRVDLRGGTLNIYWNGLSCPLFMTGPATHVYDGTIYF